MMFESKWKEKVETTWITHRKRFSVKEMDNSWKVLMGDIILYFFATADDPEEEMIDDRRYGGDLLEQFP